MGQYIVGFQSVFFPRDAVLYQLSLYLFADQAPWLPVLATCYDNYNVPTLHMPDGRAPLPPCLLFQDPSYGSGIAWEPVRNAEFQIPNHFYQIRIFIFNNFFK